MRLAADGVRFLARRSARGEYSVVAPMPGVAAVVELRAPQLGALQVAECYGSAELTLALALALALSPSPSRSPSLQVAEWSRCAKAEPPIWTEAGEP